MARRGNSQIQVDIALNTEQLEAGQKRAVRQFQRLGSSGNVAQKGLNTLGRGMKTVGLLGGAMAGAIGVASAKMVELGSDAEESANAFSVTFKEATEDLNQFVEGFSKKAGFTNAELQQLLSFTGGVVNGMGASAEASSEFAKQIAVLSGDIGSLRNIDPSDVLDRITKSLTGEREGLKQLGIVINQVELDQRALTMTNKSAVSELTALDRAHATLNIIQERSSDALGDLDNTSEGFANTQRRLKAELRETATAMGGALMPIVNDALPVISEMADNVLPRMVEAFKDLIEKIREFHEQFGSEIMDQLKKGFQAFKDIGVIVADLIGRFVDFIKNSEILGKVFGFLSDQQDGLLDKLNDYANGIRESNSEQKKQKEQAENMTNSYKLMEDIMSGKVIPAQEEFTESVEESVDALEDEQVETKLSAVEFNKYTGSIKKALSSIKALTRLQERGKAEEERLNEATGELEESNIAVAQAQISLGKAQEEVTALQKDGTEVTAQEELAILKLRQRIEELTEAEEQTRETELELAIAKAELNELIEESTKQSDKYFDAVRSVEQAEEDLAEAIEDQKKAREEQIQAKKDLAEATKVSAESILEEALAMKELQDAFGSFEGETFIKTLERISEITGRKIEEIRLAFANAGLTAGSFNVPPPSGGGGNGDGNPDVEPPPTFGDSDSGGDGNLGAGAGAGSGDVQPIKIYTTLNIDSERFETVTQDAMIRLQKQGKKILL